MCPWIESYFQIELTIMGLYFSIELLKWGRNIFRDFWGNKSLATVRIFCQKMGRFAGTKLVTVFSIRFALHSVLERPS